MVVENDYYPPFSKAEYERRHKKIREAMKQNGLDCLLIYGAHHLMGTDMGQLNTVYLSSYAGFFHTYVVFPLNDEPTLFIVFGYHVPNAKDLSVIEDVRCNGFDIAKGVGDRLKELGLEKASIGIVGPFCSWYRVSIPVEHHNYFTQTFPKADFKVVTEMYENLRLVKSEEEIRYMERGAAMTDLAHEEVFLATRPGVRHSELHEIVLSVAGRLGGKVPFSHVSSTPMSDPQQFYPDPFPTHRTVKAGDVVLTEITVGYGGYFGKIFGTYFVGEPTREYRKLFEVAASVYDSALRELKPGSTGRDVKKLVAPIQEAGYTTGITLVGGWSTYNHPPYVGAIEGSFGAAIEDPSMLDFVFEPGHCIGVMSYPITQDMKRGVWIGTICVFTEDGLRNLHSYPANEIRVA